ncbi:MAG: MurR/RpiR family transcriptional regulator, partial [Malacoplasma sp.]|nr:MurR/RpiR family transcriptional regulator [Malacoplasma sp.]
VKMKERKFEIFEISKYENLKEMEKELLGFINENPYALLDNDIITASKILYSSKSNISRLSKKIGFKHLIDMKLYMQATIALHELYDVKKENDTESRISNLKAYNIYAINETLTNIEIKTIKDIAKDIKLANRVFCFGIGSSFLPAYELSSNLMKLGINCTSTTDIHNLLLALSHSKWKDFLIIFSKSGKGKEITFLLKVCENLKIDVAIITTNQEDLKVKYKILMSDLDKHKRIIATSSKICMLAICDVIYYELYSADEYADESLSIGIDLLEQWKRFSSD